MKIFTTTKFKADLEEAAYWLYSRNILVSAEFADLKFVSLKNEINSLILNLQQNPRMGQTDEIYGIRRFPVYDGRYQITWLVNEANKSIVILEFIDSKYPKNLRQVNFDD